jgi:hypothetical protein
VFASILGVFFGFGNRRVEKPPPPGISRGPEPVLQSSVPAPDNKARVAGNKRDDERIPLEGQVEGEVMVFQPMTILDISVGGAQIETAFALQLDSLHDFRLTLGNRSIVVKGRIAHCHIGQLTDVTALYRTGVEFVDLTEHARNAISTFVTNTKYSRNSPSVVDGIIADDE